MSERILLSVDDIAIDTTQVRGGAWDGDELDDRLIDSIKGIGLIHDCIVRPTTSDKYGGSTSKPYALIAGSRRLNALIRAGIYEIPCRIIDLDDLEAIAMSYNENVGRKDLTQYQKMIAILTWTALLKRIGKSETEAINEIAKSSFGGDPARVYTILRSAELPKELQILVKEPAERTDVERHILEEHNIAPNFKLDFTAMSTVKGILDQLEELPISEKVEKIFSIITDFELDKKGVTIVKQREVLRVIRNKLSEGKTFDVVINELKDEMKIFTMVRPKAIRFRLPNEYQIWHTRACTRANIAGEELVLKVYLDWLENQAKKEGW